MALRAINFGLYVLTAIDGDDVGAAGVNWLTQASFEPPLIAVAVKTDNDTHRLMVDTPYGFEARVTDTVKRGDHTVFVVEVVNAGVRDEKATPMLLRSTGMNYGG